MAEAQRHTPIAANQMKQADDGMWVSIFDYEELEERCSILEERLAKRGELTYEGSFPLAFLKPGEVVRASLDGAGGCEVVDRATEIVFRIQLGKTVVRNGNGLLELKGADA